jgi:predicted DCC family thiol-disulfide oxidoreductase YuxK
MNNIKGKSIVLFDGVCNLCNSSVNFIIKHDSKQHFIFASLQSDVAKTLLLQYELKKYNLNTILLIENGIVYEKSTAVLKILKHLNNGIHLLYGFIIVPKMIRDWVYNVIAKNRYTWFGKKNSCMIPSKENLDRFI